MDRYFKRVAGVGSANHICFLKSKGLSLMKMLHLLLQLIIALLQN